MIVCDQCRLLIQPDSVHCLDCFETARQMLFRPGCAPCKVDFWFERLSQNKLRKRDKKKRCSECGSNNLQKICFSKWVAKMAAIRKVVRPNETNLDYWPTCDCERQRRIELIQAPNRRNRHNPEYAQQSGSSTSQSLMGVTSLCWLVVLFSINVSEKISH